VLTIVNVGYPLAPAGRDMVGGSEQIVAALDAALVAGGHRSIVIAPRGSRVSGELVELPVVAEELTTAHWIAAHDACRAALRELIAREPIDVIHLHGIDFHAYLPPRGPAVLATLHLPLAWYPPDALRPTRPDTYLHCVSRSQRTSAPGDVVLLDEIENGVDLERLRPDPERGDHVAVLGRICPEKAPHLALDAATAAGVPLLLAGRVFGFPEHQGYFRTEIEPRLRGAHRFIGVVAGAAKTQLIARARCVVIPSVVDETSSLVAMEALACGTPVIGFARGALVDLIEQGVTGWLVETPAQLADAIARAGTLDRAACRAAAEAHCSHDRMVERYLARYRELTRRTRGRRIRTELLDRAQLAALTPAWDELWSRTREATIFQHSAWVLAWCRHLLHGDVSAVAIWRDGRLAELCPLFRWLDGDASVLSLIGAGASDYLDAIGNEPRELEAALRSLAWDRLELSELRDGSPLLRIDLPGLDHRVLQEACPALAIDPREPFAALHPGLRREIAYQRRRAARELGLRHEPASLDELWTLHRARWQARGETGVLDRDRLALLEEVADHVIGVTVRFGDDLAAVAIGLSDRDCIRYYLGGFDPRYRQRSAGTLAIAALIEEAARRGARTFDLLRGAEPYKYRFGAVDRTQLWRRVVVRRRDALVQHEPAHGIATGL
jgi:glycosyltransferase involved in cell wall biosynthesis/CelD/BcsL family acetyltransferase involved in cellulose biosynthesis